MTRLGMTRHGLLIAASSVALIAGSSSLATFAMAADAGVTKAVGYHGRPELDVKRDKNTHAADVMAFAGLKPGVVVADLMPGNGYWARIMSGIVGPKGDTYLFVLQPRDAKPMRDPNQNNEYTRAQVAYSVQQQPEFTNMTVLWDSLFAFPREFNVPKQLDATLTADYATIKAENPKWDMVEGNKAIYRATKNGGLYIVVGEPGAANALDAAKAKEEVTAAGFTLAGETNASGTTVLKFQKPMNAPDTDMRPKNISTALAGYYGNTRRTNPGLIRKGGKGERERRVMFNADGTYEEWGQSGSGNNPWQSGKYFFSADGEGCMIHMTPVEQQGFINCDKALAPAGMKPGDIWFDAGTIREFVGTGYVLYPEGNATQGGTLGTTPEEKARKFGQLYGFAEGKGASHDYLAQYLEAYGDMKKESGADAAKLDAEFAKSYGKPVPTVAGGTEATKDDAEMSAGQRRDAAIAAGQRPPGGGQ